MSMKFQDLKFAVSATAGDVDILQSQLAHRERLLVEVGRTVRLGRLLKTRLKEPLLVDDPRPADEKPLYVNQNLTLTIYNALLLAEAKAKANEWTYKFAPLIYFG